MSLPEKLLRARESRGLTIYGAANRMVGVSRQQLINLEAGPNATRPTNPKKITVAVACEIVSAYWPDVQLADFFPGEVRPLLKFAPADSNAGRALKGFTATG